MRLSPWPIRVPLWTGAPTALTDVWQRWLSSLVLLVNLAPAQAGLVARATYSAAIPTTTIPLQDPLPDGMYRVTFYAAKTQAATTSSSLTVTIRWVDGGLPYSLTFAPLTLNTAGAVQSQSLVLHADAASAITYAVAYASA